jgi:hypothetical protein
MNFENFFRGPWRRFRTFITQRLAGGTRTVRSLEKIAVSVDDPAGYRARLRVRMAKALTIDATSLTALVAGK